MIGNSRLYFPGWKTWLVSGMLISGSVVMMLNIWHLGFSVILLPVDAAV